MRLGKLPPKHDDRTLQFRRYLTADLPAPPPAINWQSLVPESSWNIDGNDRFGDCVEAAKAHQVQSWTFNADPSAAVVIPPDTVVADYLAETGGQDTGLAILDSLNLWRSKGMPTGLAPPAEATDMINAYAQLGVGNFTELQQAISLFGGAIIGVVLPDYILSQPLGQPWDVSGDNAPADPNNGHCVVLLGYDGQYYYCLTWGVVTPVTPAFLAAYMDEAYAVLSPDWIGPAGQAPDGFDMAQLQADLAQITSPPAPAPPPDPTPPPTPPPDPTPPPTPSPPPATDCAPILDSAEAQFRSGHVFKGIEGVFAYVECVIAGGAPAGSERHGQVVETIRRRV